MNVADVCRIAAETAHVKIMVSYCGENKFAVGISDGTTTPIVANGTPEEIEASIAGQLPDYQEKIAAETAVRKAKEEEEKRKAAERTALAELNQQRRTDRIAARKTAETNKENQLELNFG